MIETMGVAISTTGHEHRMGFLETAVAHWRDALGLGHIVVVTVDGSQADADRVQQVVGPHLLNGGIVLRVGQPLYPTYQFHATYAGRCGVAANKNTGIEFLMEAGAEHLFLSDDDCWPLMPQAPLKHVEMGSLHSMVVWGKSRLVEEHTGYAEGWAEWNWPRGVMLYANHSVIREVGGMDERFGPGGHEHAEWSRRIHQAGLTPAPFISPASYAYKGVSGNATRAGALWHCEDMRRPDETGDAWSRRKAANTTISREARDWDRIDAIMKARDGDTSFVPYKAHDNGRSSATLCVSSTCAVEPEPPRSDK